MKSTTLYHIILAIAMIMVATGQELHPSVGTGELESSDSSESGSRDYVDDLYSDEYDLMVELDDPSDDTLASDDMDDDVVELDDEEVEDAEPSSDGKTRHLRGGYSRRFNPAQDGIEYGQMLLDEEWINIGNGCANAFKIERVGRKLIGMYCTPTVWDNWRRTAYKRGCARGIMRAVRYHEKECLGGGESGIDECNDLGEAAATLIAEEVCPVEDLMMAADVRERRPNWRKTCKRTAIGICKGNIYSKVKEMCGKTIKKDKYDELKRKCRTTVKSLVN
eukprot:scaffold9511_cov182-Skeletonema_dohrnii-CCMP3373.AAC.12